MTDQTTADRPWTLRRAAQHELGEWDDLVEHNPDGGQWTQGVAYARRYNIWGRELGVMAGLADLDRATSIQDVARAAGKVTWNENIMAADDKGNIGWWHPGLLPLRPRGYDERLPYPGTGQAEWRGFLSQPRY